MLKSSREHLPTKLSTAKNLSSTERKNPIEEAEIEFQEDHIPIGQHIREEMKAQKENIVLENHSEKEKNSDLHRRTHEKKSFEQRKNLAQRSHSEPHQEQREKKSFEAKKAFEITRRENHLKSKLKIKLQKNVGAISNRPILLK